MSDTPEVGKIGWIDMTLDDATSVRDFYQAVVGWESDPVDMGGYSDYVMKMPSGEDGVAGICHARGSNAEQPAGWMIYIIVEDIEKSAAACAELGGKVVLAPRGLAGGQYCVIEDPGGALAALYQP